MKLRIVCAAIGMAMLALPATAHARSHHHRHHVRHAQFASSDPRPSAWCGWWMRKLYGIADKSFNLAINWSHFGHRASGPAPGVIGVQPHHVFKVLAVVAPGKVLAVSGNDGHRVRERVRSTSNVVAWREP